MAKLAVGDSSSFTKTISESDVYLFAGITGDLHRNHIDESYMRTTKYGHRIAHGTLLLGFASAASAGVTNRPGIDSVSYGYDRIRIIAPVFFGETIRVDYKVDRIDEERKMAYTDVRVTKDNGTLCMVATHLLKYFD